MNSSNLGPQDFETFLPDDETGRLLRQMRESGVDMNRPHPIDFFFEFSDEVAAQAFHREENEPLASDCCFAMDGRWVVRVTKLLIPTHQTLNELEEKLVHIAAVHHGKADGWSYSPD